MRTALPQAGGRDKISSSADNIRFRERAARFFQAATDQAMPKITPHIAFNGNAEEAFRFYQSVLGGEFARIVRFKDLPLNPDFPIPEMEAEKLMYIALSIAGESILTANDVPSSMGFVSENENRSKISVRAESKEEAAEFFHGLSHGGDIEVPFEDSPEGAAFGMFRDKYGIEWMIHFDPISSK